MTYDFFGLRSRDSIAFGIDHSSIESRYGTGYLDVLISKNWKVNDLIEFLDINKEMYDCIIASIVKLSLDYDLLSGDEYRGEISLKDIEINPFESILENLENYVDEDIFLEISYIHSESELSINFEGLGPVIEALRKWHTEKQWRGIWEAVDEYLRLKRLADGREAPFFKHMEKLIEIELKKRLIKSSHKLRKFEKKYGVSTFPYP